MKTIYKSAFGLLFFIGAMTQAAEEEVHSRRKRNVFQLGAMVQCAEKTGESAAATLTEYNGYGCYCGMGGGGTPVDDTDKCCMDHDNCYNKTATIDPNKSLYMTSYAYTCEKGVVTCCKDNGAFERALCECDKKISLCFDKTKDSYQYKYRGYNRNWCKTGAERKEPRT